MKQVTFKLDYSGGWGSHHKDLWSGSRTPAARMKGPSSDTSSPPARCPTARTGSIQKWHRLLPPFGLRPTFQQRAVEMQLSHFSGDLPEFVVKVDWVYRRFDHLYGWLTYKGKGVYGFKATKYGSPLDTWGRNVIVDTYDSRYGRGWKRENGFLTHRGSGGFCYGFYPHGTGRSARAGVPSDRDGPRRDADPVLAGPGARAVRPQRSTTRRTRSRRRSSRTPSAASSNPGR